MGRPITCPSYAFLVGTVVFDAKHICFYFLVFFCFTIFSCRFRAVVKSWYSGHIRIQSEIIIHIRSALSFISQYSKKPGKYKNDSQTAKSHLISQNFSSNLFCQLAKARTAKKLPREAVVSMDQNPIGLPIEQTHFFLNQRSAVNDINFQ